MGVINGITRTITMLNHLCYFNLLLNLAGRPAVLCICEVVATLIKFCKAAATRRYICGDSGSRLLMAAAAHRRFGGNYTLYITKVDSCMKYYLNLGQNLRQKGFSPEKANS